MASAARAEVKDSQPVRIHTLNEPVQWLSLKRTRESQRESEKERKRERERERKAEVEREGQSLAVHSIPELQDVNMAQGLCIAAGLGDVQLTRRLLLQGAAVDQRCAGATPLYMAAQNGHLNVVKWLFWEGRASVSTTNRYGNSPLYIAARNGHADIVRWLAQEGRAAVNQVNRHGLTPLHIAALQGNLDVVRVLVQEGACVNQTDRAGTSPLHCAAERGNVDMVKLLVREGGARVEHVNVLGLTALQVAVQGKHFSVVEWLAKEGSPLFQDAAAWNDPSVLAAVTAGVQARMRGWLAPRVREGLDACLVPWPLQALVVEYALPSGCQQVQHAMQTTDRDTASHMPNQRKKQGHSCIIS
eukprot:g83022.t1